MKIISRDGKITIRTQYDPEVIEKIKGLPKRKWNKHLKVWTLPSQYLQLVKQTFPDVYIEEYGSAPNEVIMDIYQTHIEVYTVSPQVYELIEKICSFDVPDASYSAKYKLGEWDGKICLYNKKNNMLPIGLLGKVRKVLNSKKYILSVRDFRKKPVANPKSIPITLRKYQKDALKSWKDNDHWGIIAISPGLGKTEIAIQAIADLSVRTLFLVHTQDLAMQAVERLEKAFGQKVGFIGAGEYELKKINVGIVQTFHRNINNPKIKRILEEVELIVADEAHHYSSRTFNAVMQRCNARYRLGLTATPYREAGDELVFTSQLGNVVYEMSLKDGVKRGWLCKPIFKFTDISSESDKSLDEYQEDYLTNIVENRSRNFIVIKKANEYIKQDKSVLILVNRIDHGKYLQKYLNGSVFLSSRMKKENRAEEIEKFRNGENKCVIATSIFDEGVNVPQIDVLINAVAQKSRGKYIQRIGRAMRINRGKEYCVIEDFIDGGIHTARHSWMRKRTIQREGFMVSLV